MKIVHCKKEPYDILIDRTTKWGNPFIFGKDGDRHEVIYRYACWILTQPDLLSSLHELDDKTLGCWCRPQNCHGDVLRLLRTIQQNGDALETLYYNE